MQSQHRIVPDGSRSAQQNRVLGSPGSACWASLFLPPAAKLAVVSWSERHSLPGSLWVRGSFCVFSLKCAAARPAGASWCFLTTWDFMHHAFNKRRQQETRSLSPKLNPHHYLHTHTHTHTHTSLGCLIPGFTGLALRKYSCNLGLDPKNPSQQQWLRPFDILILVINRRLCCRRPQPIFWEHTEEMRQRFIFIPSELDLPGFFFFIIILI